MNPKACRMCSLAFEITDQDLQFYEKISPLFQGKKYLITPPTLCPDCRATRRLSFRNERKLYIRNSDLSGKHMVTMYSPEKKIKVYDQEEWWGDQWDPLDYGRDFDFHRPFFEQFAELMKVVPRINLMNKEHENSEYCNFSLQNKNSYLLFTSAENENAYYSNRCFQNRDICDCMNCGQCELCYELIDSENCYRCAWVETSAGCSDCYFSYDLKNCQHCFACFSLENKKFCLGNEQLTEEAYHQAVKELMKDIEKLKKNFQIQKSKVIHKYQNGVNNENSTGDNIYNCKNAKHCFEAVKLEDCSYVSSATNMKDSYDVNNDDNSELIYEAVGSETNYHNLFCDICWFDRDLMYCSLCFHSENLFGCVGLKRKKYCILNKQYTKEEYETLAPRIIEHMRKNSEWGEFFPSENSPFEVNETMAMYLQPQPFLNESFKIIAQEKEFYKKMELPEPNKSPEDRYRYRLSLRNLRKLWKRKCTKCQAAFETAYSPDRPETIYCEKCYLEAVY